MKFNRVAPAQLTSPVARALPRPKTVGFEPTLKM